MIDLKPSGKNDKPFLKDLFYQQKRIEYKNFMYDEVLISSLIEMQYYAQQNSYSDQYPLAESFIAFFNNIPVGKIILDKSINYHIVDILILPNHQNKGVGTQIIKTVIKEAKEKSKDISLMVASHNPAKNLYKRLGFEIIEAGEVYLKMRN
jgi:ribosomal protein S18 acetylase RimI-like enzyme